MSASGAIPLMLALPDLTFTDAYFESMSGLTTTGSTVLNHLDDLPQSINLWRHTLHWIGGIGIIVLAVAVLPLLGVGGMQLYKAETPGPGQGRKAHAAHHRNRQGAVVHLSLHHRRGRHRAAHCRDELVRRHLPLLLCDRTRWILDARRQSIGYFNSFAIELVLIVIMIVAAFNFSRHFLALRTMSLRPYKTDSEGKAVLVVLSGSVLLVSVLLWLDGAYPSVGEGIRHSMFNVVSIATTTGFVTEDYEKWPAFLPVWLLFLSCITCSTGSTGGGIKMFRTLLLVRQARRELKLLVHPSAVIPIRIGGSAIPERVVYSVLAFIFLYFGTVLVLTFALLATGLDLVSSFSAVVGSVNNLGPGLGRGRSIHQLLWPDRCADLDLHARPC